MAGREIKTTLAVDGEQAFKRSLNEAKTSIRNLGTQLTLAQAEFKKDGDAMKLMETRSKALKGEISAQKEIVKALEGAVKDAAKKYGEGSTEAEKWQAELNRAKAAMASLEAELNNNEKGLDRNGKAFDTAGEKAGEFSQSVNDISRNVSFDTITSGIGSITSGFESAISKAMELGKKMWDMMRDAAQWADDKKTLASVYGVSTEELQQMEYASKFVDTSVDTIANARKKLSASIGNADKGSKSFVEAFQELRVPVRDANQQLRDLDDIFWDAGHAIMSMTDPIEQNNVAMKIFGKSWDELRPMFEAGRDTWEKAKLEAPVVSDESIERLASFQDQLDKMDSEFQALKINVLSELAPAFETLAKVLTDLMKEFNEYLQTEEGQKMMADLRDAIENFFSGLKDVDFQGAVDTVKGALEGIKGALDWVVKNKDSVKNALLWIAGGFAALKVGGIALTVGQTISGWKSLVGKFTAQKTGSALTSGIQTGTTETTTQAANNIANNMGQEAAQGAGNTGGWLQGVKNSLNQKLLDMSAWANVTNITNSAAVGDWWTHNTKSGRWASNKLTELLGGTAQFADEGGPLQWIEDWAAERVSDNERRASGEANVLWDIFDADAKRKHARWEDSQEEINYWREMHPFNEEQATVAPEGVKPWSEMDFAERHAWKAAHPGVTEADMSAYWLRGHTTWNQAGSGLTDTVTPVVYAGAGGGGGAEKQFITTSDLNDFKRVPGEMERSVGRALSQVEVRMDRESVGRLVAPVVSRIIAQDTQ